MLYSVVRNVIHVQSWTVLIEDTVETAFCVETGGVLRQ